jgi:hypothetical protein
VALIDADPQGLITRLVCAQRLEDALLDLSLLEFHADFLLIEPSTEDDALAPLLSGKATHLLLEDDQSDGEALACEARRLIVTQEEVWWSCVHAGTNNLLETGALREETVVDLVLKERPRGAEDT